ncbi:MAG: redoxin domain-containing protein [Bacteroidales bacterium]|nr:redoxin domain-containing protein [Bacteroidales bacterium]
MKQIIFSMMILLSVVNTQGQNNQGIEKAKGLEVGDKAPSFSALNANNEIFILKDALKKGPIVLIFYRGFWCPVCNQHLATLQDSLQLIEETGAQVIAISPEKPEYLDKMSAKSGASFTLLYDEDYKIATAFDVNYKASGMQAFTYNLFLGAKLKKTHSTDSQNLPIPATYIINKEGIISWRQFDPNYKNRSSVKDIIRALEKSN